MTKPSYRLINPQANRSFVFKWEVFDLSTRWHYHPELELIYFMKGRTNSVIGDGFGEFAEGDLVLMGANFPHVLQENPAFKRQNPEERPFGLIIQFTEDFLGETFKNTPEMQPLRGLFQRARRGMHFGEALSAAVKPLLHDMYYQHDTRKLVQLLNVLVTLAESNDFHYLVNQDYYFDFSKDEERMWRIKQYVYANFQESISISKAAEIANMSETAFCRYFKTRTLKTFTRFLNEIRIAYACKLLQKKDSTVTQACFESGFNSLSYFDRTFKEVMGKSPLEHRRMHEGL